ncbi:porin [Oceanicoccus sp. KOV_DT_Chl]|uniref:porin n=1 Tax=Oceanicoccus sp. KOV_DT_Chl TaxID=1904639 RepID=UPI000C7C19D4|nr:porin [Oceanicoccus sp. KOV_DT_Chl]
MKLKLLPAAIVAASTFTSGAYAADMTVYGKANLTLNNYDLESDDVENWQLESNASRVGVKGSLAINDNLKAIYKMEFEVYIDDGDSGASKDNDTFEQRNIYAGIQGGFGTVIAGKHDTPTKLAQSKIDKFNDLPLGDIKNLFEGENRESNIVMYTTPDMDGLTFTGAFIPGETNEDDSIADGISVALSYNKESLYLALAVDDEVDSRDTMRAVAEYTIGDAKLGFMYQTVELSDSSVFEDDEDGFLVSGEYKVAPSWVLKAQYGYNETEDEDGDEGEYTQLTFGADYKLSKATKVFAYYSTIEADEDGSDDTDDTTFAVGYELKF